MARAVSILRRWRWSGFGCLIPLGAQFRGVRKLRPYEILVIVDPRPTDEEVAALLAQLGEQVKALGAEVGKVDNWGKRRLAYDIRKQREGADAGFEGSAQPSMMKEVERQLRLNERGVRVLSARGPIRKDDRPG